jgi:hypothetical protein
MQLKLIIHKDIEHAIIEKDLSLGYFEEKTNNLIKELNTQINARNKLGFELTEDEKNRVQKIKDIINTLNEQSDDFIVTNRIFLLGKLNAMLTRKIAHLKDDWNK